MITNALNNVDELLGSVNTEQSSKNSIQLRIERSDELLEYQIPNLDRDVFLTKRPNGILFSSIDNNQNSVYFALPFSKITSVSVLETFTEDSRYNFSYTRAFAFSLLFGGLLVIETKTNIFSLSGLLLSLAFGVVVSGLFPKPKRQNVVLKYFSKESEKTIIFSFGRKDKQVILEFISSNFGKTP